MCDYFFQSTARNTKLKHPVLCLGSDLHTSEVRTSKTTDLPRVSHKHDPGNLQSWLPWTALLHRWQGSPDFVPNRVNYTQDKKEKITVKHKLQQKEEMPKFDLKGALSSPCQFWNLSGIKAKGYYHRYQQKIVFVRLNTHIDSNGQFTYCLLTILQEHELLYNACLEILQVPAKLWDVHHSQQTSHDSWPEEWTIDGKGKSSRARQQWVQSTANSTYMSTCIGVSLVLMTNS